MSWLLSLKHRLYKRICSLWRYAFPDIIQRLCLRSAYDTLHAIAEYADDRAIISNNADPLIASRNLQNRLYLMEKRYTNWRLKVNQNISFHTTFTLKSSMSKC